jgi:hypothetical protein
MKDPIVKAVTDKFQQRSEIGIKKYGVTLERDDLTADEWAEHLQQELMDAVLYLERLKQELVIFKTKQYERTKV